MVIHHKGNGTTIPVAIQSVSQFEHSFLAEKIEGTTFLLPLRNCDKNGAHGSVKTADRSKH